jgi:hypothetical protein
VRLAATSDYRWSALIIGIVKSQPFQMRMPGLPAQNPAGQNSVAQNSLSLQQGNVTP